MREEVGTGVLAIIALIAFGFAIYCAFYAPCESFVGHPVKDLPARCLKEFSK